ncbi:unnamed protein product [Urochloa decumbens]|uniref:Glu-AdT subunit C n=1 Tax=Urochloa decumbens TaxID=240449 RepID=A0ABC8Y1E3_9POAL
MLSVAASAIPRLRRAAPPRPRLPPARSQWLRPLSSATQVPPAAAAGAPGSLEPPDLPRLASAARISLSPQEVSQRAALFLSLCEASVALCNKETDTYCLFVFPVSARQAEELEPKIRQFVDWFGQLQAVDLESIEPSIRAGTAAGSSLREDKPEAFVNRDAIVEAIPSYDDPYIKVPRVLNKE